MREMALWDESECQSTVLIEMYKGLNHTLARMTLWPETLWSGQNDILARVTFWKRTVWPETVWPERQFSQCHFGW